RRFREHEADFTRAVDTYVAAIGMAAPQETLPALRDGFAAPLLAELDLAAAGIATVIWTTSYRFDFSIVRLPAFDADGYPIQERGVTDYPRLFFIGLPWLHNAKFGLIFGVGDDADYIARTIAGNMRSSDPVPSRRGAAGKAAFA